MGQVSTISYNELSVLIHTTKSAYMPSIVASKLVLFSSNHVLSIIMEIPYVE